MSALAEVRALLGTLRVTSNPMPARNDIIAVLVSAETAPMPDPSRLTGRQTDLTPALAFMVERGSIRSSGDLGRALTPDLTAEKACSLGGTRMRQLIARGWAIAHDLGGYSVTDDGRKALTELARLRA